MCIFLTMHVYASTQTKIHAQFIISNEGHIFGLQAGFFFFTGQHLKQHAIYSRNRLGGKWDFLLLKEFHNCFLCHFHSYHCVTLVCKPATICTVHFNHVVNFFVNFQGHVNGGITLQWKSLKTKQLRMSEQKVLGWQSLEHLQPIRMRMSEQKALGCQTPPANQSKNVRTEGSGLPIIQAAPANQNATNNILHEKPEDWPPCLAQSLSLSCTVQGC